MSLNTNKRASKSLLMSNITKTFLGGKIIANDNVTLNVASGEIHAIIGENGAGKSTLMSILFGLYQPDSGTIKLNGETTKISTPLDAAEHGIGMVHQHFKLVDTLTVAENIILGQEPSKFGVVKEGFANDKVRLLADKYKFNVEPTTMVGDLSIGQKQKVEILKMLWNEKDILIFDEPTAVLTPDEIEGFMEMLRFFKSEGKTIIIITHKLGEVKAVADNYTVLRKGKSVSNGVVKSTSVEEMANQMVGKPVAMNLPRGKAVAKDAKTILEVRNLTYKTREGVIKLDNVSFEIKEGEILGFAGVEGNGQEHIVKCIYGLMKPASGQILVGGVDVTHMSIKDRMELISYITEERHQYGLALSMEAYKNIKLPMIDKYSKKGLLDYKKMFTDAQDIIERFDVRGSDNGLAATAGMSGGNQQKLIIGREIVKSHKLLLASQPTRGLDIGAIENTYKNIVEDKDSGAAVLLVSFELPEILGVSDRIAVINKGKIVTIMDGKKATAEQIGLAIAGISSNSKVKGVK